MTTIVVFASSLFATIALVSFKAVELKCGKKNFAMSCICRLDDKSDKFVSGLKFKALQLIQSTRYIMLVQIKAVCKNLLHKVEERIAHEYKMKHTMIMGQKDIINKGSVSFYLKKITEGKSGGERGKIE
ncbi:MAG: hypothetical protein V1896_02620 [Candidatus Zambryskibacteria bacterium]